MASKSSSRILTDHDEIRHWAEERGARPAAVRSTASEEDAGIIRLDFPGYSGEGSLEEIEWDEWFETFDDSNLALVVQDSMADGQKSNFNKLVSQENAEEYSRTDTDREQASSDGIGTGGSAGKESASSKKTASGSHSKRQSTSKKKTA